MSSLRVSLAAASRPTLTYRLLSKQGALLLLPLCVLLALPCGVRGESDAAGIGASDWLRPSYHFTRAKFHMNGASSMHEVLWQTRGSCICCHIFLNATGVTGLRMPDNRPTAVLPA